ncbi:MAG TPA: alpha/beta hydrolase [Stellaceae bacterium]|nr:alpha/beta hydrolase [Stellaceae bacterium]
MLYRGMDKAALDAAYNTAAAAGPERRDRIIADWTQRSAALGAKTEVRRDLRYGEGARHRLDIYRCGRAKAPLLVFIHGGYWQFSDKETYAFLAAGPLAHGVDVAIPEYTLAPAATIDAIVAEMRRALAYLRAEVCQSFVVSGHSAGGHLATMTMDAPGVAGVVAVSGLYDLEPIRLSYLNDKLGIDEATARRNSPLHHIATAGPPVTVAWGAAELSELCRQSAEYCDALVAAGRASTRLVLDGQDHYGVLEEFANREGKLTAAVRALAGR